MYEGKTLYSYTNYMHFSSYAFQSPSSQVVWLYVEVLYVLVFSASGPHFKGGGFASMSSCQAHVCAR